MYLFESLNQLIQTYLPEDQIKRLRQAYLVARDAHEGQTRSSGEPYITHPVAVACILAEMKLDYETLMAALLHDVIEDTPATYQDMEQRRCFSRYRLAGRAANSPEDAARAEYLYFTAVQN